MKATQTNFTYMFNGQLLDGSYLGRKRASRETLTQFLRENAVYNAIDPKRQRVESIGDSFLTEWEL